jgi:peptidoglycan/xylan/chitin deacetylase (PgdA/CDA1 family)
MSSWAVAGAGLLAGSLAYGVYQPNSLLFGPVIRRGSRRSAVYLTLDDGPNPGVTARVLDILAERRVPAAFFMVGRYAECFPDLVLRAAREGHLIGNHTQHHAKLHRLGLRGVRAELARAHEVLSDIIGTAPRAFRAPHGYRTPLVTLAAAELGYRVFGWTFGVWDSACPGADRIRERVRARLASGAILLLHDGDGYAIPGNRAQTAAALPGIIRDARAAGLEFRPPGELL